MEDYNRTNYAVRYLLLLLFFNLSIRCGDTGEAGNVYKLGHTDRKTEKIKNNAIHEEIAVTPPPFTDGIFPCMDCHKDRKPNPVRRNLVEMHDDISGMFEHDKENRWCTDCHDLNNRDSLKLASGKLLDFKESYKLCGQCHGDKLRDWKVGVHGKRIGEWNGKKQYFLCVSCHNPHSPKFKPIQPLPPPFRLDESNK